MIKNSMILGLYAITMKIKMIETNMLKGFCFFSSSSLKLGYRMLLTIKNDKMYMSVMTSMCLVSGSPPKAVIKRVREAIRLAAAGIGSPLK